MNTPDHSFDYPSVDEALLRSFPPVLHAVERALGHTCAREFLHLQGGVNVSIPKHHSQTLGLQPDELNRLRHTLAPHLNENGRVTLPKADKLIIRVRNTQIRHEQQHSSIRLLAHQHNLSSRQIQNICREGDDRQLDLF